MTRCTCHSSYKNIECPIHGPKDGDTIKVRDFLPKPHRSTDKDILLGQRMAQIESMAKRIDALTRENKELNSSSKFWYEIATDLKDKLIFAENFIKRESGTSLTAWIRIAKQKEDDEKLLGEKE